MTTANREAPHHRNLTCYTNYGCRLPECTERYRSWNRNRMIVKRAGQWQPHVDAEPVRRHLSTLEDHGISLRQTAAIIGVGHQTIHGLVRRPVRHTVRPGLAAAILAIDPTEVVPVKVDSTGTGRRIQALVANGWPMAHLAPHLDVYRSYVHALTQRSNNGQLVLATTVQKIADGYERLKDASPASYGISSRHIKQARSMAASRRWPPATYWADRMDVIDDPHFEPMYRLTRREIVAQDAHELMRFSGLDRAAAAERLGVSKAYVDHAFRDFPQYAWEVAA